MSRAAAAAFTIDELLFQPARWQALDEGNQLVPRVRAGSLTDALALVGRGRVATVFGRLRPGVAVVDVDLTDGDPVVAELVAWCVERDLWQVVRLSGRRGHAHVFVVAGDAQAALEAFCAQLRRVHRAPVTGIDVRSTVRPLSAPHRSGATPPLPRRLPTAARALTRALAALPQHPTEPTATPRPVSSLLALANPSVGRRRGLPADWADYLATGVPPAQVAGWADRTRSAVESTATWQMVAAGWTEDQAWLAISQAHPKAMGKARGQGRRWWQAVVWNRAVLDVSTTPPAVRRAAVDPALLDRIAAVRTGFLTVWTRRYPDPRRHTLRRVLEVLLDRMVRTGVDTVPCPQRDLVEDTGLSRPTVAGALRQLHEDRWLVVRATFDAHSPDQVARSHHVTLPDPQALTGVLRGGVPHSLPPSSFTPQPAQSPHHLPTAALLGARVWHLWSALATSDTSLLPHEAASLAGWTDDAGSLSSRQSRAVLDELSRLASHGLAVCDEHGTWTARPLQDATHATRTQAEETHQQRQQEIGAERAAYAEVRAGRGRWIRQRDTAHRRGLTARLLGAQAWWARLPEAEQAHRRATWTLRYQDLSPAAQAEFKRAKAEERQQVGALSEDQLHQAWLGTLSEAEYHTRAAERTRWFAGQDRTSQRDLVAAWEAHRTQWGITRRAHSPTRAVPSLAELDQAVAEALRTLEAELGQMSLVHSTAPLKESA